jgi:hypothetical protein
MRKTCLIAAIWLAGSAASGQTLRDLKIVSDRAPDCSSLAAIVRSVTRDCRSDDEKAIALYNFCCYAYYHHAYPTEPPGVSALKMLNVYGWGLCGGQHSVLAALYEAAGYRWRYRGWSDPGHTTVEVFYGGRWHYLDTFLKFFVWMPDPSDPQRRTIAGQEDIRANPALVTDGFVFDADRKVCYHRDDRFAMTGECANWTAPAFMVCGDTLDGVLRGVRSSHDAGSPRGWASIKFDDPDYSTAIHLAPGYALTLDWDKVPDAWYFRESKQNPRHTCGDKDYRNCPAIGPLLEPYAGSERQRTWSNGTLVFRPDLRDDAWLAGLKQADNVAVTAGAIHPRDVSQSGTLVIEMASPYAVAQAHGIIDGADAATELSTDGQTWKLTPVAAWTKAVAGSYRYFVRVVFRQPIKRLELISVVQHNQEAQPYLAPGLNRITVTADQPPPAGANRVLVTIAYCPGWRERTPEQLCESGHEIARAHFAKWSAQPVVVQKTIDRWPYQFEIPVATPKGKQPVYPRMLFVRREVLPPGGQPLPIPVPPSEPSVGVSEELATLPNPWLIGARPAAPAPKRATQTAVLPVAKLSYASKQGEVFDDTYVDPWSSNRP